MAENMKIECPDCVNGPESSLDRRRFMGAVGVTAAGLLASGTVAPQGIAGSTPAPAIPRAPKPAESLIHELYRSLSDEQKRQVVYPWDHGATTTQQPVRLRMLNSAYGTNIGRAYTRTQQELLQRILRAICSDDEGYRRFTAVLDGDNWGGSGFNGAGANIFGDPTQGQFAWVFTAHHLTLRCDGNSEPDTAFGGPMFYGKLGDGYSARNVFNFQTRAVVSIYDALDERQRAQAVLRGTPGENYTSVRLRGDGSAFPGIRVADLSSDQRALVTSAMRTILSPYRREDADEVMQILWRNGGLKGTHLAFYGDRNATDNRRWHFWRLEGPGFVWNYRVLDHVHCYVNIGAAPPRA